MAVHCFQRELTANHWRKMSQKTHEIDNRNKKQYDIVLL